MERQANEGFVFPADVHVDDLLAEIYNVSHRLCSCAAVARCDPHAFTHSDDRECSLSSKPLAL
jgi:hypothetical protein